MESRFGGYNIPHVSIVKIGTLRSMCLSLIAMTSVNSIHPYQFQFSSNNQWKGFAGVRPKKYETHPCKIESVIAILNSLNGLILENEKKLSLWERHFF